ncbi:MAG: TVP38/TMEM64 family protein [Chthoniobacteraceae bacterium]
MKRAALTQILSLILAAIVVVILARVFPVLEIVTKAQENIAALGLWGGIIYPFFYALCNVLLLPAGVLSISSGLFFGLWWGFTLTLIGNLIGAAAAFFISRRVGRRWFVERLLRHSKWAGLDEAIEREGWKIIFLSQLHPLFPTSLLNYLYGVTKIPFRTCLFWVAVGQAPGLFLYAYLGTLAQFGLRLWRGQSHPRWTEYVIWLGGFALTMAITVALARIALRIITEARHPHPSPSAPPLPAPPEIVSAKS